MLMKCISPLIHLYTNIYQHSWKWSVINPYHYVDAYILCIYAGVDGLDLVLKSRQQRRRCDCAGSGSDLGHGWACRGRDGLGELSLSFLICLFHLPRRAYDRLGKGHIYRDVWSEAVGVARLGKWFSTALKKLFCSSEVQTAGA